jgi:hypothetical protein
MLALVNRAESRLELEGPAPPGQELKLKPALVPTIEPTPDPSTDKDRGVPL